jgi:general secretion pathway protein G
MVESTHHTRSTRPLSQGFTLIELLVVLTIMATLLAIVAPRYFESVDRAKEAALKSNLRLLRESIDKYKADTNQYPDNLQKLVTDRYIQSVPIDPITDSATTWVAVPPPNAAASAVYDIKSGAKGHARDGSRFDQW